MHYQETKTQRRYIEVAEQLLAMIRENRIKIGQRLPSERDLSQLFSVSRPTVREAVIALEVSGIVETRLSSGIYLLRSCDNFSFAHVEKDEIPNESE